MPRGGARQGTPGKTYSNRTDMNSAKPLPIRAVAGQQYGAKKEQIASQKSVPMSSPAVVSPGAGGAVEVAGEAGSFGAFTRPTERPNEPVQAGLPIGPGPGTDATMIPGGDDVSLQLRALYLAYPNEHLRQLIEDT